MRVRISRTRHSPGYVELFLELLKFATLGCPGSIPAWQWWCCCSGSKIDADLLAGKLRVELIETEFAFALPFATTQVAHQRDSNHRQAPLCRDNLNRHIYVCLQGLQQQGGDTA